MATVSEVRAVFAQAILQGRYLIYGTRTDKPSSLRDTDTNRRLVMWAVLTQGKNAVGLTALKDQCNLIALAKGLDAEFYLTWPRLIPGAYIRVKADID
jgi:hypothetical protein